MLKSTIVYAPALLFPRVASFATSLFGANLLAPDQFGYFALILVIGEIAEMTATNWTRVLLIRHGTDDEGIANGTAARVGQAAFAMSVIAILVAGSLSAILVREAFFPFFAAVAFYVAANSVLRFGLTLLQISERRFTYSFIEVARSLLYLLVTIWAMGHSQTFFLASMGGSAATLVLGGMALTLGLATTRKNAPNIIDARTMLSFGLPLIAVSAFSFVVGSLDKIMVSAVYDKATLGAYAVAYSLGRQGFDILANALNQATFPQLVRTYRVEGPRAAGDIQSGVLAYFLAVALPAAGALIASREVLSHVLLPASYWPAISVAVPIVIAGAICLNIKNYVFDNTFHLYQRNYWQIPTLVAGSVATALAGLIFLRHDANFGASAMFLSGSAIALLASIVFSARYLLPRFHWRSHLASLIIGIFAYLAVAATVQTLGDGLVSLIVAGAIGLLIIALGLGVARLMLGGRS